MLGEQWNPQNTKVDLSVAKHLPCKMLQKTKLKKFSYRLGENERTIGSGLSVSLNAITSYWHKKGPLPLPFSHCTTILLEHIMPRFCPVLSINVETNLKVMLPAFVLFGALHCSLILVQFPDEVEFWITCSHIIMKIILAV